MNTSPESSDTPTDPVSDSIPKPKLMTTRGFLWVAVVVSVVVIAVVCVFSHKMSERHNKIVDYHNEYLQKIDSVSQQYIAFLSDSTVVKNSSDKDLKDQARQMMSLMISDADKVERENIKEMLDLEFARIQNEYETLALWGGILTIAFLIFSFYSFFKTEELHAQARNALDKLHNINIEAEKEKNSIDEKIKAAERTVTDKILTLQQQVNNEETRYSNMVKTVSTASATAIEKIKRSVSESEEKISSQVTAKVDRVNEVIKKSNLEKADFINSFNNRLSILENQVSDLQMKPISVEEIEKLAQETLGSPAVDVGPEDANDPDTTTDTNPTEDGDN